jgi:flagellar basal-body rod protein FlgB
MGVPSVASRYAALRLRAGSPAALSVHRPPGRRFLVPASPGCTLLHGHSACDAWGTPVPRPRRHPGRRLERRLRRREEEPVNTIDDAALIESLRQQMTKSVARQVAAAGNLANVDTPNFKAVEPTFADALKGQLQMTATRPNHINLADANKPQVREIQDAAARRDGNTVELDRELLTMQRASGDFAAAQTALAAKFKLVRYAINESK